MNELIPLARELRHQIPEVMKAFAGLHTAVMAPGALDSKTKELIALAMRWLYRFARSRRSKTRCHRSRSRRSNRRVSTDEWWTSNGLRASSLGILQGLCRRPELN